jgi:uncharacterized membrane protein YidH (DUF202 family)
MARGRRHRRSVRLLGLLLVVLGILAMVYGGFWYTKEEKAAEIGPLEVRVEKKERVNVPLWAGVALVVVGAVLVLSAPRER